MSKYIDADDVLELLNLMYDNQEDKDDPYNVGVMGAINYIKHKAPSIEIIRCRECKRANYEWSGVRCGLSDALMGEDGFCSIGERNDNEF